MDEVDLSTLPYLECLGTHVLNSSECSRLFETSCCVILCVYSYISHMYIDARITADGGGCRVEAK